VGKNQQSEPSALKPVGCEFGIIHGVRSDLARGSIVSDEAAIEGLKSTSEEDAGFQSATADSSESQIPQRSHSESRRSGRHRRGVSRDELKERIRALQARSRAFAVTTAILFLVALGVSALAIIERSQSETQRNKLLTDLTRARDSLSQTETELHQARAALGTAQTEIQALVEKRLPSLHAVAFDQVFPVGSHHVRNITFMRKHDSDEIVYEYKAVLENTSPDLVTPAISVLLFDDLGVQVGSSAIGEDMTVSEVERMLRVGEIRSYFGIIDLDRNREPAYFVLTPH